MGYRIKSGYKPRLIGDGYEYVPGCCVKLTTLSGYKPRLIGDGYVVFTWAATSWLLCQDISPA